MSPALSIVPADDVPPPKRETVAQRIQRLQAEARQLAKDHVRQLTALLADVEQLSAEIAEGGEAYPVGVRALARRTVEDCESRIQTFEAIMGRRP